MEFFRKPLKYNYDALEPYIDTLTMDEHYNAHYKKYTDTLNDLLEEKGLNPQSIENLMRDILSYDCNRLRNNGGGYYNHLLYFENLSPINNDYERDASQELKNKIIEDFGSYEDFKYTFINAGVNLFGAGWIWLIKIGNKLYIANTKNQDNPLMSRPCKILLGMDVWEHAYYLKHLSDRKSYIYDYFKVIDWKIVSERL